MTMAEPARPDPVFEARAVRFRYPGAPAPAVADVSLELGRGSLHAILGPNGSGKSTLLRLLLGLLEPEAGEIRYEGRPLGAWPRREMARRVGVVPQGEDTAFPVTVRDLVAMGRYPHLGPFRAEGREDREAIAEALGRCDLLGLAGRGLAALSAGERQRARIARALAQCADTLVLDEPTTSLDVRHEMEIFELLAELVTEDGTTVLVVTHNLNLAARYADRILLLSAGRAAAAGPPESVLDRAALEAVYGWPLALVRHPGPGPDTGAPQVVPLRGYPAAEPAVDRIHAPHNPKR